jgi:hypothetical protein
VTPLTDDEAALLYTVQMCGSDHWPIAKVGGRWHVLAWRSWGGFPAPFATRTKARAAFQGWIDLALERWREMRQATPSATLTAVGVRHVG